MPELSKIYQGQQLTIELKILEFGRNMSSWAQGWKAQAPSVIWYARLDKSLSVIFDLTEEQQLSSIHKHHRNLKISSLKQINRLENKVASHSLAYKFCLPLK